MTGSFDGGAWWMRRLPDGGFAKPAALLNEKGEVLRMGQYWHRPPEGGQGSWQRMDDPHGITASAADGDGLLDLLLGDYRAVKTDDRTRLHGHVR